MREEQHAELSHFNHIFMLEMLANRQKTNNQARSIYEHKKASTQLNSHKFATHLMHTTNNCKDRAMNSMSQSNEHKDVIV